MDVGTLQPKPQTQPDHIAWDEFCNLVLEIIAELSPCPKPTLFVIAATRGLQRFGDGTLDNLSKLLARCLPELQARGLVQINSDNLVITPAGTEEDILELSNVVESPMDENILVLTSEAELYHSNTGTHAIGDQLVDWTERPQHRLKLLSELGARQLIQSRSVRV